MDPWNPEWLRQIRCSSKNISSALNVLHALGPKSKTPQAWMQLSPSDETTVSRELREHHMGRCINVVWRPQVISSECFIKRFKNALDQKNLPIISRPKECTRPTSEMRFKSELRVRLCSHDLVQCCFIRIVRPTMLAIDVQDCRWAGFRAWSMVSTTQACITRAIKHFIQRNRNTVRIHLTPCNCTMIPHPETGKKNMRTCFFWFSTI